MADTKISALTDGGNVQSTDTLVVVRAGANAKVTNVESVAGAQIKADAAQAAAELSALTVDITDTKLVGATHSLANSLSPALDKTVSHTTIEYGDANTYYIWNRINQIHWLRTQIDFLASTGSWVTGETRVYQVLDAVNDDDPSITYGGTGAWLTQSGGAAAGAIGDTRHYGYNDDHYLEFDVTGTDALWIVFQANTLGGYVKPLINGSQALTQQHMPEIVGGDYVWSTYGASVPASIQKIADNLNPIETYTVRLELLPVATIPPGSTDNRFYFEAYAKAPTRYDAAGVQDLTNTTKRLETVGSPDSGWALNYTPLGATGAELAGNRHLNELVSAVTFVDETGTDVTPSASLPLKTARQITITQLSTLLHSETGTTDHATVTRTITFSQLGIRYTLRFLWTTPSVIHYTYYGMMPVELNRLQIAGYPTQYSLTNNDNLRYGQKKSCAAVMWDTNHNYVFAYYFDDPSLVFNLRENGFIEYLDVVVDGGKLYPKLINDDFSVSVNDIWQAAWSWRWYEIAGVELKI